MKALWMIVAALFFAFYGVFIKLCSGAGFNSWEILFYRSLFGLICVYLFLRLKGQTVLSPHLPHHILRSVAGTCAIVCGIYSLSHLNMALAMTLNYTSSLFLALFVVTVSLLRHARINWGLIGSIALGFLGVVVLLGPTIGPHEYFAAGIGLFAGVTAALAVGTVKKLGMYGEPELRIIFYLMVAGTIVGGSMLLLTESHAIFSARNILFLLALSMAALLGQLFLTMAFSRGNMVLSGALQYTVIFFATILGEILFGEQPTWIGLIGMTAIIVASISGSWFTKKEEKMLKALQRDCAQSGFLQSDQRKTELSV